MYKILDRFRVGLICSALVIIPFAIFWQVRAFEFLNYDDGWYVNGNGHILTGLTLQNIKWVFISAHGANWHPLTGLSHILDCQLFGLNPGWHHMVNLFFHIANTLLLFTVLRKMTVAIWQSAFVAALFAIHPLHVESVAWISERKDVLSTMFWLLTTAAYFRYVKNPTKGIYVLTLALFALGLMAKPMLVTLPFVLLLLDYWPLNRLEDKTGKFNWLICRRRVWEKMPFFILAAASGIITFLVQKSTGAVWKTEALPLILRVANAVGSYVKYIEKLVWPTHLAIFYPHPTDKLSFGLVFAASIALVTITVGILRIGNRYKYLPVGWFWYLGTLVPVIGLVQVGDQAMADRYTYVPFIGLFLIIACAANDILANWKYRKIILSLSAAAVVSIFSVCTWFQTSYWRNSITLFEHALKVTNGNYVACNNLALAFGQRNKFDEAINSLNLALRIKPDYLEAYNNLGMVYGQLGRLQEQIEQCNKAIRINPLFPDAYYNLAEAYSQLGQDREAIQAYKQAIELKPDYAQAYSGLGVVYSKIGLFTEAVQICEKALKIDSANSLIFYHLGIVYEKIGRYQEAVDVNRKAIRIRTDYADAYNNLGVALGRLGRYQEAVDAFNQAIKIKPDYAEVYSNLGFAYHQLGRNAEAIEACLQAIEINPTGASAASAYNNLGTFYGRLGRYQESIQAFEQAIKIKPDFADAHSGLGFSYLKSGDKASALKQYEILKSLDPQKANTLLNFISK